ncbi:MAG: ribose 5-phosphate isomerase B [Kordiimonas sp.]|nr:ribose 5-phosphate isomerase B [Kordiimonas sp.]
MSKKTIALASDHGGYDLKETCKLFLLEMGYDVVDLGTDGTASVDYPDFADAMATALKEGIAEQGVLFCGTGIGISIAANRYAHIRAALVHDALSARLCREHNDANVLVLGGRTTGVEVAKDCLKVFLNTPFEGGRHQKRIDKFS